MRSYLSGRLLAFNRFFFKALIYLRFANIITIKDNGRLQFQRPSKTKKMVGVRGATVQSTRPRPRRLSFGASGCFDWGLDTRDGTASSTTGNSSDPTSPAPIAVSSRLKQIARRLMWYPIRECECPQVLPNPMMIIKTLVLISIRYRRHSCFYLSNGRVGRMDASLWIVGVCWYLLCREW